MKKLYPYLFLVVIIMLIFLISANVSNFDYDLWARLIAGMGVIDGHQVLKEDFLSYTPTHIWWDHEYGSGVIFYFFLKHFGPYSLIVLQSVLFFFIFYVIILIIKFRGTKSPYNLLFYIFPIFALSANFSSPIRCHLFSFLFFTIFLFILENVRQGKTKLLYILPILTIIWNNLHGGVVSGLGLIVMYAAGAILDKKPCKHYIYSLILSFAALIINPWGWEYIKFLLLANTMKRPHVAEWWGLFSKFHMFNQIPFKVFMFLILGLEGFILWKKYKSVENFKNFISQLDFTKYIVLIITLILSIQHIKLLPFFVISASAFCYKDFEAVITDKLPKWTKNFTCAVLLIICLLCITLKNYEIPLGTASYPHREVEFIKINNLTGNVLVNFGFGSFVSYKLYPQNKIYMDGRYEEVYYDDMVPLLDKFFTVKPGWDDVLKKYPPDILIIEKYYQVYDLLMLLPEWSNIFETEKFGVFVRTKDVRPKYKLPPNNTAYFKFSLSFIFIIILQI